MGTVFAVNTTRSWWGVGTVCADDPRLTCRLPDGRHPRPVVLDTGLRIPAGSQLLCGPARAILIAGNTAKERPRLTADVIRVGAHDGRVCVIQALEALGRMGVSSVLVEGGALVHRSMLQAGVVDRLVIYIAPKVIPGGRAWVGGAPLEPLAAAPGFSLVENARLGSDVRLTLQRTSPDTGANLRRTRRPVT